MPVRLDHLVILVESLEEAVAGYEAVGFRVTPGGIHADGLTHNALVSLADGTYLELVAFVDPEDERDNVWGWRPFLASGGGLIDYCVVSDDLETDTQRLEERCFKIDGPVEGGRRLPDGGEIRWKSARIRQQGRMLPFLLEDLTPRTARVPGGKATGHPNGAAGISRLLIAVRKTVDAWQFFATLAGERVLEEPDDTFRIGPHEFVFLAPEALDPGPFAVELDTTESSDGPNGSLTVL